MAQLLNEIDWAEPIFPPVADPEWEKEAKRRAGTVSAVLRRVAPLPWLREVTLAMETFRPAYLPPRLKDIGAVVTAQENACRYCYGATRAYLHLLGYREHLIGRIEREAQLAELDEKERAFIEFCRSLARSQPRPARAERERLLALGYSPEAVTEIAYYIAGGCYYNRVATLTATPPEASLERFVASPLGRAVGGLAGPVLRAVQTFKWRRGATDGAGTPPAPDAPFANVSAAVQGLPAAGILQRALQGAFASSVLPTRTKALMFAVVARSLECDACGREADRIAVAAGLTPAQVERILADLGASQLEPYEARLLDWVRDTVHYQPAEIQEKTRALVAEIGELRGLEAIGVASLANATVRLAILLD